MRVQFAVASLAALASAAPIVDTSGKVVDGDMLSSKRPAHSLSIEY
jgi:hypothetical protein